MFGQQQYYMPPQYSSPASLAGSFNSGGSGTSFADYYGGRARSSSAAPQQGFDADAYARQNDPLYYLKQIPGAYEQHMKHKMKMEMTSPNKGGGWYQYPWQAPERNPGVGHMPVVPTGYGMGGNTGGQPPSRRYYGFSGNVLY